MRLSAESGPKTLYHRLNLYPHFYQRQGHTWCWCCYRNQRCCWINFLSYSLRWNWNSWWWTCFLHWQEGESCSRPHCSYNISKMAIFITVTRHVIEWYQKKHAKKTSGRKSCNTTHGSGNLKWVENFKLWVSVILEKRNVMTLVLEKRTGWKQHILFHAYKLIHGILDVLVPALEGLICFQTMTLYVEHLREYTAKGWNMSQLVEEIKFVMNESFKIDPSTAIRHKTSWILLVGSLVLRSNFFVTEVPAQRKSIKINYNTKSESETRLNFRWISCSTGRFIFGSLNKKLSN